MLWERELGRSDFSYGQFGENFTADGLADDDVLRNRNAHR
jgi:MOSC domain-containing protein YiiM